MKTVIVTPVANEEATIEDQIRRIAGLGIPGLEALFVMDDYCKDKTRSIIEGLSREMPWVHLEFFAASTGVVSCYLQGLKKALAMGADRVLEMDAGLSHDPALIPVFLKKLDEGYDAVFGSRFVRGGGFDGLPWYRRWISGGGTILANMILGTRLTDMTGGYEAFSRKTIEQLSLDDFLSVKTTHFYQTEMRYYCHRLHVCEVPVVFHGSSTGLKPGELSRSLKTLAALRSRKAL